MSRALSAVLDEANPNKVATALQQLPLGRSINLVAKSIKAAVVSNTIVLPNEAKAVGIISALAATGTVVGYCTPVLPGATLATTQVKVNQAGNIAFFATDAVTSAEVVYLAPEGPVVTEQIAVVAATGIGTLGADCAQIISATVTAGTLLGAKTIVARAASAPSTGNVNADLVSNQIRFAVADAVTAATIVYVQRPAIPVDSVLRSSVNY